MRILPVAILLLAFATCLAQAEDRDQVELQTKHRLLAIDNHWNRLLYLDQCRPGKSWTIAIPGGSRDLQLVGDGKVLASHGNGAAEYDLATGRRLKWIVERYSQINTARRLANGNTLLGADTAAGVVLYELNRDGKQIDRRQSRGSRTCGCCGLVENGNLLMTVSGPSRRSKSIARERSSGSRRSRTRGTRPSVLPTGTRWLPRAGRRRWSSSIGWGERSLTAGGKKAHPSLA